MIIITGDVNGMFDNFASPAIAAGYQSYVKFYITTANLSSCGTSFIFYLPLSLLPHSFEFQFSK